MRKLVALILAAVLACMMIPALAEEISTGEWNLTQIVMGDTAMSPAALGMSMTITLNEDGTAAFETVYGDEAETEETSWTFADGVLTLGDDDDPLELVLEDGELKTDMDGGIMVFSQEAPAEVALPVVIAADSEDAFIGSWTLTQASVYGVTMPVSALGIEASLEIEPGQVTMTSDGDSITSPSELADGALKIVDEDGGETIIQLNDNGWVSITQDIDGEELIMYFERAE